MIIRYERHGNRKYVFKGSSENGIILSLIILKQAPFIQQNLFASPIKASKNKLANKKNLFLSPFNILPIEYITIYWSSIVFRFLCLLIVECSKQNIHSFSFPRSHWRTKSWTKKKPIFPFCLKRVASFVDLPTQKGFLQVSFKQNCNRWPMKKGPTVIFLITFCNPNLLPL